MSKKFNPLLGENGEIKQISEFTVNDIRLLKLSYWANRPAVDEELQDVCFMLNLHPEVVTHMCCSGHGVKPGWIQCHVTEEGRKVLDKIGHRYILSCYTEGLIPVGDSYGIGVYGANVPNHGKCYTERYRLLIGNKGRFEPIGSEKREFSNVVERDVLLRSIKEVYAELDIEPKSKTKNIENTSDLLMDTKLDLEFLLNGYDNLTIVSDKLTLHYAEDDAAMHYLATVMKRSYLLRKLRDHFDASKFHIKFEDGALTVAYPKELPQSLICAFADTLKAVLDNK